MRAPYTQLYVHLVWATWDRLPLITPDMKSRLVASMVAKCQELRAEPIAVAVMPDHAHLLVRLPSTLAVATLVKEVKGASAHLMTHVVAPEAGFKWQGGYGAFTLAKTDAPAVQAYIRDQERHHAEGGSIAEWELPGEDPSPPATAVAGY